MWDTNAFLSTHGLCGAMSHADMRPPFGRAHVTAFAVCIQSCYHPIVSQLTSSGTSLVCAWLIASRKKKRRSRATPLCVVETPPFPLSRSHILCTGPPCRESPSLRMYHITGFFNARLPGCRRKICTASFHYTLFSEKISTSFLCRIIS